MRAGDHLLAIPLFIAFFALAGCLLYLPFFLWFRWRRPRTGPLAAKVNYSATGWSLVVAQLLVLFAGFAIGSRDPHGWFGRLAGGPFGGLRWAGVVVVLFTLIGTLLRGTGIALERAVEAAPAMPPAADVATSRGFHLATLAGVPVHVHRSYLLGGLLFAFITCNDGTNLLAYTVGCCLAYAALFAIHEFAHAVVARRTGLRVHSVELSGFGGLCLIDAPRETRQIALVYSAGLTAQAMLLLLTLGVVAITGRPMPGLGTGVVMTFTWANAVIFLINMVPGRTSRGALTDGGALWALYRHVSHGQPHPFAAQLATSPLFDPSTRLLTIDGLAPAGFRAGIEMLNDDTTPMEFVVQMLEQHAGLAQEAAFAEMLHIHTRGGLLLPLPDRLAAEAVAGAIARDARAQGHALVCRAVSVDD